jgi:hypothetical protein
MWQPGFTLKVKMTNSKQCPTCKREMVQLFLTQACDYCDYGPAKDTLHRGFIVFRDENHQGIREEYVFRTRMDAERWRTAAGREEASIREVYSSQPFRWHLSRGTLRDVVLADHMFEIFDSHRFEALPHRAFLSPNDVDDAGNDTNPLI